MLVNMLGIEPIDEIVDIGDRRVDAIDNPKARITLTTLFGAVLTSFITAGSPPPPQLEFSGGPVAIHDIVTKPSGSGEEVQRYAA